MAAGTNNQSFLLNALKKRGTQPPQDESPLLAALRGVTPPQDESPILAALRNTNKTPGGDALATSENLQIRKGLGFNTEEEGLDTALTPKKRKKNLNRQFIDPLGTVLGG